MPKKAHSLELPFLKIDRSSRIPYHEQIYMILRDAIRRGVLKPGLRLPSSREISIQAGVGRNTATHALETLSAEGHVRATSGSGTFVSFTAEPAPRLVPQRLPISEWARAAARDDVRTPYPGDSESFPWKAWRDALAAGWRMAEHRTYLPEDAAGLRCLREAIAECVGVMRGIACNADEVIVTSGARESVAAVARLPADPGDTVLTDCADPGLEQILRAAGLLCKSVAVDESGFDLADAALPAASLAFLVPSSEGAAGTVMAAGRRYSVVQWAKKHGTPIIEYDFDSLLDSSFDSPPALKSIDRRNLVMFVGSIGDLILPQVRIGFAVVPASLREALLRIEAFDSIVPSPAEQLALAWFIRKGLLTRHIRRLKKVNQWRRRELAEQLTAALTGRIVALRPRIPLQLELTLSREFSAAEIASAAALRGIEVTAPATDASDQLLIVDCGRLATSRIGAFVCGLAASFEGAEARRDEAITSGFAPPV